MQGECVFECGFLNGGIELKDVAVVSYAMAA